jgi:hypothetical protein
VTDGDPDGVNPRRPGSPVLRRRRPDGRLSLRPGGTDSILPALCQLAQGAARARARRLSVLVNSIPKDKLFQLLDESFKGFNGAGYDLQSLLDSSAKLSHDARDTADHTRAPWWMTPSPS